MKHVFYVYVIYLCLINKIPYILVFYLPFDMLDIHIIMLMLNFHHFIHIKIKLEYLNH